jgi:hypothetical protein
VDATSTKAESALSSRVVASSPKRIDVAAGISAPIQRERADLDEVHAEVAGGLREEHGDVLGPRGGDDEVVAVDPHADDALVPDQRGGEAAVVGRAHEELPRHAVHRVADGVVAARRGEAPAHDDDDPLGHGLDLVEHVRAHDHGAPLVAEALEELDEPEPLDRVGAVERFVEHQHEGVLDQGGGHLAALAHALAEAVHAPVGGGLHVHGVEGPLDHAAIGDAVQVGHVCAELAGRQPARHGFVLGHQREPLVDRTVGAGRAAVDHDGALVDRDETRDRPHEGGLPSAIGTEEAGDAGAEAAAEIRQRDLRAEPHRHVARHDDRVRHEGGVERARRRRGRRRRGGAHRSTSS